MPIIRARYPDNWEAIALRIKHQAQWCCQECQRPCRKPSEPLADFLKRVKRWRQGQTPLPPKFEAAPRRYLLTVAHLDQQPSNQDSSHLKALCTVCHLQFDSQFRAKQRRLKAEFLGQLCIDDAWSEGLQLSLLPTQIAPFSMPRQGQAPAEGRALAAQQWSRLIKKGSDVIAPEPPGADDGLSRSSGTKPNKAPSTNKHQGGGGSV